MMVILTDRPVSNTSTSYPGVAYGHMGDGLHLGYQAAMVSLHSPIYGRFWLSVVEHPGDTVSCTQAEALVQAAETAHRDASFAPNRSLEGTNSSVGSRNPADAGRNWGTSESIGRQPGPTCRD